MSNFTFFDNYQECSKCGDTCCRFYYDYKKFSPYFSHAEKGKIVKKFPESAELFKKQGGGWQNDLKKIRKKSHYFYCSFWRKKGRGCTLYDLRPLDCQLYPILLCCSQDGKKILACVDDACPLGKKALRQKAKLYQEIKKFCGWKEVKRYLKQNKDFVEEYQRDVVILGEV